jgi:hypothetical protein
MENDQQNDLQMNNISESQKKDFVPKTKPGWKTTEFWLTLLAQIFPILESISGHLNPEVAALIAAAAQAFYAYQRYKLKAAQVKNG